MQLSELPDGMSNTLDHSELPSVESTAKLFASHYRRVEKHWRYPEHVHPLFEINMVLEGEQLIRINGTDYWMQAGDLLIISPNQPHDSRADGEGPMSYFCLHFDIDDKTFRQLLIRTRASFPADSKLTGMIRPVLDKLMELTRRNGPVLMPHRMQALSSMFELFSCLGEMLSEEEDGLSDLSQHTLQIAGKIADFIDNALYEIQSDELASAEMPLIAEIAGRLGYSPSYCNRIFHLVYGMSPRQYVSSMKLKQAKLMLLDPKLSIEQIARRLGYRDISHFSRQFKRWTGMSPSHYRQHYASRLYGGS
ncbi:AraC family transcriptional regulator [Paenibacillus tarimensis]